MSKCIDMKGLRFGRLTVIDRVENKRGQARWLCKCDCGNEIITLGYSLRRGDTTSCGCYHAEILARGNRVHGLSNNRIYAIWSTMKARCSNPNNEKYHRYGERGIKVCDEWQTFEPFYEWAMANGYSEGLSIDRIDNNGNYEPSNCRWATPEEQANNTSKNKIIAFNGETKTISEWAKTIGVTRETLWKRIFLRNWSIEKALTTPKKINT